MAAQALNCPNCGAAVSSDATRCEHCNSRLATIACPQCFGMIFLGAKYCSHCGAAVNRTEANAKTVRPCPRCKVNTKAVTIGTTNLRECPKCEGVWADTETLQRLYADREQQAALLGVAVPLPASLNAPWEKVVYRPCPVCLQLMNRVNFARCSTVIVDVCQKHGTWFDKNELRRIVEFIRAGGFDKARGMEIERLEQERRKLDLTKQNNGGPAVWTSTTDVDNYDWRAWPLEIAAEAVMRMIFK
jgi:Zn-finger nucleic acid-binding protein